MIAQLILVLVLSVVWIIGIGYLSYTFYLKMVKQEEFVPFIPSDPEGITVMCDLVGLKGNEKVIDVGSGWGTIVFFLAKNFPKLNITGIEIHPVLHFIAWLRSIFFRKSTKIRLIRGDAAKISYSSYDVVFLFMLSPFVDGVLVPKIEKELSVGSKVVSYVFRMNSPLFSEKQVRIPGHGWKNTVYLYTKIADK